MFEWVGGWLVGLAYGGCLVGWIAIRVVVYG